MARFSKNDWVEITSTPDLKWPRWSQNRDFYQNFLGKVGKIIFIDEDAEKPGNYLYKIRVEFENDFNDGFIIHPYGTFYATFKADHLILSSEYDFKRKQELLKAGEELQKWEYFKKKSVDDMLKHIFAPETKQKIEQIDEWEEKTPKVFNFDFIDDPPLI